MKFEVTFQTTVTKTHTTVIEAKDRDEADDKAWGMSHDIEDEAWEETSYDTNNVSCIDIEEYTE